MALEIVIGSLQVITNIIHADGADEGYPRKGVHYGGGRHVEINDDPAVSSLGWTFQRFGAVESDDATQVATWVDYIFAAGAASELTGQEMAAYAQRRAENDWPPGWTKKDGVHIPPGQAKKSPPGQV